MPLAGACGFSGPMGMEKPRRHISAAPRCAGRGCRRPWPARADISVRRRRRNRSPPSAWRDPAFPGRGCGWSRHRLWAGNNRRQRRATIRAAPSSATSMYFMAIPFFVSFRGCWDFVNFASCARRGSGTSVVVTLPKTIGGNDARGWESGVGGRLVGAAAMRRGAGSAALVQSGPAHREPRQCPDRADDLDGKGVADGQPGTRHPAFGHSRLQLVERGAAWRGAQRVCHGLSRADRPGRHLRSA